MNNDIAGIMGGQAFDTHSVEPASDFSPLPPGEYPVIIEKAEVKQTKAGTGSYLQIQLSVIGEKYQNRKLFGRITLANPNETAVDIGRRELAALGQAVGLKAITDSQQLVNARLLVKVKVKKGKNSIEDNEIAAYKPLVNAPAPSPASPPTQATGYNGNNGGFVPGPGAKEAHRAFEDAAQPQDNTDSGVPPWMR
jgi:hypothetical protein